LIVFWRKYKLDWSYAIGELFIVTIGVLIALAINEWNTDRLEKKEEYEVISRFISDIKEDLSEYDYRMKAIDEKEESLLRVEFVLANGSPQDANGFLRDIIIGANYGWNQGQSKRATFDDLLGSGRLRIISDFDVRSRIAAYYEEYKDEHNRIDARETAYPHISYQLVPRSNSSRNESGVVDETSIVSDISDERLNELVNAVQGSSIGNHVVAEINLARFIRGVTKGLQIQASDLVTQLKEYQTDIE
jgi:hypothetical protein